jgi:microsomal dipeptidase-like Zn-dependent dipeptidase
LSLALLTSVPPEIHDFKSVLSAHEIFVAQALSNPEVYCVRTRPHLENLLGDDIGVLFGMQHAPKAMTQYKMGLLQEAGLQSMTVVYGKSANGEGGLSDYGRKLIGWMSETGIILDVSDTSHRTIYDALNFIQRESLPIHVMASHSKNMPDEIFHGLVSRGGYIGIPPCEGDELYKIFARAVEMGWIDSIGVGSDCHGVSLMFNAMWESLRKFSKRAVDGFLGDNFRDFLIRSLPRVIGEPAESNKRLATI